MSLYNYYSTQGIPYQNSIGTYPGNLLNPNLQWGETRKLQVGIDLGFFSNRILLSGTYGRNRSSNELLSYALPTITGYGSFNRNFPSTVQNTSWEFSMNTINIKGRQFEWTSSLNLTIPNVSLSYQLPAKWEQTVHLKNCRIYAQGQNLITITKWQGLDPESQSFNSLPPLRVWTLGLQIGL
jgi:hypothetical protein